MAQITVYVPDDVAAKAREYKDEIVFSQIFTEALKDALVAIEVREPAPENDLGPTIERLKKEKQRSEQLMHQGGFNAGWKWAKQASYAELKTFVRIGSYVSSDIFPSRIASSVKNWARTVVEVPHNDIPEEDVSTYKDSFYKGMVAFFEAVKDKL